MFIKKIFSFYCLLFFCITGFSQNTYSTDSLTLNSHLHIRNVIIKGNKNTKPYLIEREMQLKRNDSIPVSKLEDALKLAKQLIYNTTLFTEVKVDVSVITAYDIDLVVEVKERWYIFPVPQFQLIDRNLNDWVKTFNASLTRVNYGLKFVHYNLSGRRDQLRIYLLNGYSRNFSFNYTAPYSNSALTEGFTIGAGYTQNREISYKTSYNNKVLFYPVDSIRKEVGDFVRNGLNINAAYSIRRGYYRKHNFYLTYNYLKVYDSIVTNKFNPNYFNEPTNAKGFIDLSYSYQYLNVNNVAYPLKGTALGYGISKRGLRLTGGINSLTLNGNFSKFYDLGKSWYSSIQLSGMVKLPFHQAYINQRGLGYGDTYLRGLEYYVIDGIATGLAKTTLKYKLLAFKVPFPFKSKSHPYIPFTFFAKTFGDIGYCFNKNEFKASLNNKLLYAGGIGIDLLTLYDVNLRFEYSFNQLGEKGLFLHTQGGF